jgi:hypothetical protein
MADLGNLIIFILLLFVFNATASYRLPFLYTYKMAVVFNNSWLAVILIHWSFHIHNIKQ